MLPWLVVFDLRLIIHHFHQTQNNSVLGFDHTTLHTSCWNVSIGLQSWQWEKGQIEKSFQEISLSLIIITNPSMVWLPIMWLELDTVLIAVPIRKSKVHGDFEINIHSKFQHSYRICKPVISLVHGSKILKIWLKTNYYTVLTGLEPVTGNDSTELLLI